MLTIDKAKVDEIIDGLLGNNDLTASPEVWYGLYQIKNLPATEIVRCGECKWWTKQKNSGQGRCELLGIYPTGGWYCANGAEERTDG